MIKKILIALILLFVVTLEDDPTHNHKHYLTLFTATDIHYLSPSRNDNGPRFMEMIEGADGKLTDYSEEIVDKLVSDTIKAKPNALLLTGDLTFNGELQSLKDLANKLKKVEDAGIDVYVIPGNHDIASEYAYQYSKNDIEPTQNILEKDFKTIMGQFGYDDAAYVDPDSFSYCVKLDEETWLLALDANTKDSPQTLKQSTINFMNTVLQAAKKIDAHIISMTHQNILPQISVLSDQLTIHNHEYISKALEENNTILNLSGHAHIQHQSTLGNLTEIITESLSVYPLQYGIVHTLDEGFEYENKSLNILQSESKKRFFETNAKKIENHLTDITDAKTKQDMIDYAVELNEGIFSGAMNKKLLKDKRLDLWKQYKPNDSFFQYLIGQYSD